MSLYDYRASQRLGAGDPPFYALIMAAMRQADTDNAALLRSIFPDTWKELQARYNAPGGCITPSELAALRAEIEADIDRVSREEAEA